MKPWDRIRKQFKPDGKGRFKTMDAMEIAKQIYDEKLDLEEEVKRLKQYKKMVWFIANDYYELSHDKVKWQRDDWKKRCRQLIEEDNE